MIFKTKNLSKNFKVYNKEPGLMGSIKSLYKRDFTTKFAVKGFDLEIPPGQILGLLGPNGAGKTTLMKMFTGIIVPSEGEIEILGYKPFERDKEFRRQIALVMGQKSQLWWDIPAMDSFLLLQKYYEIPEDKFKEKVARMAKLLGVESQMQTHVRKLSLGERMKMELMASLLHEPKILFLDEPTIGLDLISQENVRNFLKAYQEEYGVTIILTSHYMADVQALCSRIVLILGGEKAYDGPINQFESILGTEKFVSFNFSNEITEEDPLFQKFDPQWEPNRRKVDLRIPLDTFRDVSAQILHKYPVVDFQTEKLPIENVGSVNNIVF
jgi:ABC-2 type transport system ATP-binding protein